MESWTPASSGDGVFLWELQWCWWAGGVGGGRRHHPALVSLGRSTRTCGYSGAPHREAANPLFLSQAFMRSLLSTYLCLSCWDAWSNRSVFLSLAGGSKLPILKCLARCRPTPLPWRRASLCAWHLFVPEKELHSVLGGLESIVVNSEKLTR